MTLQRLRFPSGREVVVVAAAQVVTFQKNEEGFWMRCDDRLLSMGYLRAAEVVESRRI